MKKILIFYGAYGGGHLSAAKAIKNYIDSNYPDCETMMVDCVEYINKYLNINTGEEAKENVYLSSYINKNVNDAVSELNSKGVSTIVIGNGDKVVNQYPGSSAVLLNDKVYLLTNNYNKEMIDVSGMSYKDATNILKMLGINYETEGIGYVY